MKPTLRVLCGIQGSGKSTYCSEYETEFTILSSDVLRFEYPDYDNNKIFELLYEKMNENLKQNHNIIIDATNITIKARAQIFDNLKVECIKEIIIFNTPIDVCKERVTERNKNILGHHVPLEVVDRYYKSFEVPFYEEGWDYIGFINAPDYNYALAYCVEKFKQMKCFNQNNKHHTQNLFDHCQTVANQLDKYKNGCFMFNSAIYHDVGKLFTQTYKDGDPNAHYYNHANVGTYELMCNMAQFDYDTHLIDVDNTIEFLFYINYHMHLYNIKTTKAEKKWRKIFGDTKYNALVLFNKCDKYRPENEEN